MNKIIFLLILSLVLLPLHVIVVVALVSWTPIKHVKDPHILHIGEVAVSMYDKQTKSGLKFMKVVRGESQVVSRVNYRLLVAANIEDDGQCKNYVAVVLEKPWLKSMNLTSFKPVIMN
ncbi:PREDICTED: cysteine proteinase inhibitor 5-like [Camelina sativa]|uniref:Cysteine proteinase inhibitor 5-like n=1 Tax=Camelina sativa TaxID=90675 RepID=A0ABM1Q6Z0_CAMSA|nr:PREDICTED: cysteine proteinase inhibitor 5-like [Camelina sativa]